MRIVITGASGNVGTALLRRLAAAASGHDLVGIVRRAPAAEGVYRGVRWHEMDLADEDVEVRLRPILDRADAVVHLAWGFQPTRNTEYLSRVGVGGTRAVVYAAHAASVGHLVHMSSVGAYAPGRYGEYVTEDWPVDGIRTSPYSRDKSSAEALLDAYQDEHGGAAVPLARMRPGFIVQRDAASGLMRYALPGYVPMSAVPFLPVVPVDRRLCIPLVHADDVAAALVAAVERHAVGPFNLAADPPVRRADVAEVLDAGQIHVPSQILGALVDLTWRARLQPIDRGWLDMAFSVPLLDCSRAGRELGWEPEWSSVSALADVLGGVARQACAESPPLRRRSLLEQLRLDLTRGLMTSRHLP